MVHAYTIRYQLSAELPTKFVVEAEHSVGFVCLSVILCARAMTFQRNVF